MDLFFSGYGEPNIKVKVIGIKTQMESFDFIFGIRLSYLAQFNKFWDHTLSDATILEADNQSYPGKKKPFKELKNDSVALQILSFIQILRATIHIYIMEHLIL